MNGFESRCVIIGTETARIDGMNPAHAAPYGDLPVSKIKPTPQVGDVLWVKHAVKRDKSGATVLGLMRNDKPERTIITAVMLCGAVRNNHSDVWECKPSKLGNWETINPDRVEK